MFDDDDYGNDDFEYEREKKRVKNLPIVKKAEHIFNTVRGLSATFDKAKDELELGGRIFEDIAIINAKIRGAEAVDLYTIKMENAVIIKIHAKSLLTTTNSLKSFGLGDDDYIQLLRDDVEEFRNLFIEWVATFQKTDDYDDGWGLF